VTSFDAWRNGARYEHTPRTPMNLGKRERVRSQEGEGVWGGPYQEQGRRGQGSPMGPTPTSEPYKRGQKKGLCRDNAVGVLVGVAKCQERRRGGGGRGVCGGPVRREEGNRSRKAWRGSRAK